MSAPSATHKDARETILARIQGGAEAARTTRKGAEAAPETAQKSGFHTVPERGRREGSARLTEFISEAERAGATVARVRAEKDVPEAVLVYLRGRNVAPKLRIAPAVAALPWASAPALEVLPGEAQDGDGASLSRAFAAVAETGTLVLLSGADNPTRLNLLPETHLVIVAASDVEGSYEDAWNKLRRVRANERILMPRTVNWITGPSRTADIEQTLLMGAHGPKDLHILIVGN